MSPPVDLEQAARRAQAGDQAALERLIAGVRDDIYRLSLRMLWHPEDAEDATQEVLIRIITGLGGFRGGSSIRTWAYRVAANHLLTTRRRRMEMRELTFQRFAADLEDGLDTPIEQSSLDEDLLAEEVRIGCTHAMLLCLDREHRLAYVLGEIMEIPGPQAAAILEVPAATHRKRLERARQRIGAFMRQHCGLVNTENPCRCRRRIGAAIRCGRVDPVHLLHAPSRPQLARQVRELTALQDAAALFRAAPPVHAPATLEVWMRRVLTDRAVNVLEAP